MTGTRTAPWSWRQRERTEVDGSHLAPRRSGLRLGLWGVMHFLFYFLQQIAELLAPLFLVIGIGWWSLPRIVAAVTTEAANTDGQARDMLNTISGAIPAGMHLAGYWVTPGGLVALGLAMMAAAAIGATLAALAARGM